jgi:hypothetical protein
MREQRSKPEIEVANSSLSADARVVSGWGSWEFIDGGEAVRASHECPHLKIEMWGHPAPEFVARLDLGHPANAHLNLLRVRLGPHAT